MQNFICLYRKYRPRSFNDLIGQDHVKKTLVNSIISGRYVHAYLFSGPRGTGKTSTARLLAKALNCRSLNKETGEPCNDCACCRAVENDTFLDIIEIDAASHTGIANVREEIQAKVNYMPGMGVKKVYIIDEVHMLSTQAFNGLLKTIEEPPGHVLFVLATTEPHKVPATILSRCQRFTFRRVRDIDLIKRLEYICEQEKIEADKESLEAVLRLAGGGVRDAVSLLDKVISFSGSKVDYKIVAQVLGIVPAESQKKIFTALFKADYSSLVEELNNIESLGYDILRLSQELVHNTNTALLKVLSHVEPHAPFQMISLNDMVGLLEFLSRASAQASKMEDPFFHIRVELLKLASKFDSSGKSVFSAPEASARTHVSTHVDSAKPKSAQPENRVDEPDNSAQPENRVDEPDKTARAGSASQAGSAEPAKAGSASQAGSAEPAKAGSVSQAGAVEPVKTGLASPVSGLGISVTRENWDQLLGLVRKKDAVVHALLREGRPEIHGENLKIIFKKQHAFHQGQLSEERYLSTVRSAAAAVFEQAVSVSAHLEGDETEKKKLSEESLMEKALKDPRVKHLLDISGGKLIKVIPENKLNK